jgi:hypothetical protein
MTATDWEQLTTAEGIAEDTGRLATLIGVPFLAWAKRCHEISVKLLQTGEFGPGAVARGWCAGVRGQHSWIVLGTEEPGRLFPLVYDPDAIIVDPTVWSYVPDIGERIWVGPAGAGHHSAHGSGFLLDQGRRQITGQPVELSTPLPGHARQFLAQLGPMDRQAWSALANGPMQGWPSGEIIAAMKETEELTALVPIDIADMLITGRDPSRWYR